MPDSSTTSSSEAAPGGGETRGERVVLVLFVILAACVLIVFSVFYVFTPEEARHQFPELLARYLYIPIVATSLLVSIDAWRRGRSGWWLYGITAPVPVLNVVLAVLWLKRWRRTPKRFLRWDL